MWWTRDFYVVFSGFFLAHSTKNLHLLYLISFHELPFTTYYNNVPVSYHSGKCCTKVSNCICNLFLHNFEKTIFKPWNKLSFSFQLSNIYANNLINRYRIPYMNCLIPICINLIEMNTILKIFGNFVVH